MSTSRRAVARPKLTLRRRAVEDLEEIGAYTLSMWGDDQLVSYIALLHRAFEALAADPHLGKPADDIREGYFRHHVGSHIVFFKRKTTGVEIVRILHEKMSPARHL
jgi:toxin ParE1/3/4